MSYTTQNELLLKKLLEFYNTNGNLDRMLSIINGNSRISLRIVDWFATNYAKKYYTVYDINNIRFKVSCILIVIQHSSYTCLSVEVFTLSDF